MKATTHLWCNIGICVLAYLIVRAFDIFTPLAAVFFCSCFYVGSSLWDLAKCINYNEAMTEAIIKSFKDNIPGRTHQ